MAVQLQLPLIGNPTRKRGQDVVVRPTAKATTLLRDQVRQLLKELEQEPEDGEIPAP